MIKKVLNKTSFQEQSKVNQDLEYWLTRTPSERVEAVELLRRQMYGSTGRLQRVVRIIDLPQD